MRKDMRALYQEVILDHNRKPRNFGPMENPDCTAHGHNPLCGDSYTLYVKLNEGGERIEAVMFEGDGCAISKAAASMMTRGVKGKDVDHARMMIEEFRQLVTGKLDPAEPNHLGHLKVFQGVSALPVRIKCALLPWHALKSALAGSSETTTEGDADPLRETPEEGKP